ncbi:MAG: DUF2934 domain-containing protein [Nitrospira sp. NTP2]|nr:DUF2934 domain-containing protein [Nitrospira sp. NTP2]RIK60413.1 MAG: hypothetical protein DCC63_04910 [Nitrospira sp.]
MLLCHEEMRPDGLRRVWFAGATNEKGTCMKKKPLTTKSRSRPSKKSAPPPTGVNGPGPVQDLEIRIAARAYELYQQRGCLDGYHLHDWLQAEREILGENSQLDKSSARI